MLKDAKFRTLSFLLVIGLVALAAILTLTGEEQDPCANPQGDISASVLADEADQDGMVNRAILVRAECEKKRKGD